MNKRAKLWSEYSSLCLNCFLKRQLRASTSNPFPTTPGSFLEFDRRKSVIGKRTFQSGRVCSPKGINLSYLTIDSLTKTLIKPSGQLKMIGILGLRQVKPTIVYQFENVWQNGRSKTLNHTKRLYQPFMNFPTLRKP